MDDRDFKKFIKEIDISQKPADFFIGKTNHELLMFIREQQDVLDKINVAFEVIQNYSTTVGDVRQAKVVLDHWKRFNEFLDANPDYKQEWETLCMAMRLQES